METNSRQAPHDSKLIFFNIISSPPRTEPEHAILPLPNAMNTVKPKQVERTVRNAIRKAPSSTAETALAGTAAKPISPTPVNGTSGEAAAPVAKSVPINESAPAQSAAPAEPVIPPHTDAANLKNPVPAYPGMSRRLREQGRVVLDVHVLADGSVGEVRLRHSSGYTRLDQAAIKAVRVWRYVPARRSDLPISYWYAQPVVFALDD